MIAYYNEIDPRAAEAAARMVRLRGYGNAINAVQAQVFIEAFMDCQAGRPDCLSAWPRAFARHLVTRGLAAGCKYDGRMN